MTGSYITVPTIAYWTASVGDEVGVPRTSTSAIRIAASP